LKAALFRWPLRFWNSARDKRHHMHQHPPHPPRSPNKLSKSGQRLGVNGWNFSEDLLVLFRVMLEVAEAA